MTNDPKTFDYEHGCFTTKESAVQCAIDIQTKYPRLWIRIEGKGSEWYVTMLNEKHINMDEIVAIGYWWPTSAEEWDSDNAINWVTSE